MTDWFFTYVRAVILGLTVAVPLGPIGILCIQRTLSHGRKAGLISGLGTATADALCGIVTCFGYVSLSGDAAWVRHLLQPAGALILLILGWRILRSKPEAGNAAVPVAGGFKGLYLTTLILTLINPMTWVTFAGGAALLVKGHGLHVAAPLASIYALGVFSGSLLWWGILSGLVSRLKTSINAGVFLWANRVAGAFLLGMGLWALGRVMV